MTSTAIEPAGSFAAEISAILMTMSSLAAPVGQLTATPPPAAVSVLAEPGVAFSSTGGAVTPVEFAGGTQIVKWERTPADSPPAVIVPLTM